MEITAQDLLAVKERLGKCKIPQDIKVYMSETTYKELVKHDKGRRSVAKETGQDD